MSDLHIGTVISDTSGRRDCVHIELTTNKAVIRFVDNLSPSDYWRLEAWVERLQTCKELGLRTVWSFMHLNDERSVLKAFDYLIKKLNQHLKT